MGNSMVMAFNMLFFRKENEPAYFKRMVEALITRYTDHTFIILFANERLIGALPNIIFFDTGVAPRGLERWNVWMYRKIKKVKKLYQPDILVNNGEALLTPKGLCQVMLYPDLDKFQNPALYSGRWLRFLHFFSPALYKKQATIIVVSEFEKDFLTRHFKLDTSRIKVIIAGPGKNISTLPWEEKEQAKEKYAKGFEYFLYSGPLDTRKNLLVVLKGFSAFKKRQKSNMQLIITWRETAADRQFKKTLELYKYREDVQLIPFVNTAKHQELLAAAYAIIFSYGFDNNTPDLLTSLYCQVPAIVPEKGTLHEVGQDGVLTYETGNVSDLAGKMMLLFKDEKFRKILISNTEAWRAEASFEKGVDLVWETLESACNYWVKKGN